MFTSAALFYFILTVPSYVLGAKTRIVDGDDQNIQKYPFMLSLRIQGSWYFSICGATLIGSEHILTAAHCFEKPYQHIEVTYGCSDLDSTACRRVLVEQVVVPPEHNENDIAVAKLTKPVHDVEPVKLPVKDEDISDEIGIVLGWGTTETGDVSNTLKGVEMPIAECNCCRTHGSSFCAKNVHGYAGAGDSGGPYLINGTIYGVLSRGDENESVFTSVLLNIDFIESYMNSNNSNSFHRI